jgi:hypothetical protein
MLELCSQRSTAEMSIAKQQLAKHVSECYAVNENTCLLLGSGFDCHGIKGVSKKDCGCTEGKRWSNTIIFPVARLSTLTQCYKLHIFCQRSHAILYKNFLKVFLLLFRM